MKQLLYRAATAIVVAAAAAVVLLAAPAAGQVAPDGDVSPDTPVSALATVNNALVVLAISTLVPIVNGLLLRPSNPAWVKVLVANLFATAVHAFAQTVQDDGTAFLTQEWALGLITTLLAMTAAYVGFWKPLLDPDATLPTPLPVGDWVTSAAGAIGNRHQQATQP
jgi:hypothetical protein